MKVDPDKAVIKVSGEEVKYKKYIYLIMNKPDGVISATRDSGEETDNRFASPNHQSFDPFPVGRLDKDTVGFYY